MVFLCNLGNSAVFHSEILGFIFANEYAAPNG